jgi:hypothetical protein
MRRTLALVAVTLAVVGAPAALPAREVADPWSAYAAVNEPRATSEATGDETDPCSAVMVWSALLTAGSVGEPTPEAALDGFLATPVSVRAFTPPPGTPRLLGAANTARFQWTNEDGKVIATVGLATNGNGWLVNGGSVCVAGTSEPAPSQPASDELP